MTTSTRRRGKEKSETRTELIRAARELLLTEGQAGVTSRRVAQVVGLKHQIVHYYFPTIDDLLIEVMRLGGEETLARLRTALESDNPLDEAWKLNSDPQAALPAAETNALAMRRPGMRNAVQKYAQEIRLVQSEAVQRQFKIKGIESTIPPIVATVLMTGISQLLAIESAIGITVGHAETLKWLHEVLEGGGDSKKNTVNPRIGGH